MSSTISESKKYTAFFGSEKIASGDLVTVALDTKKYLAKKSAAILIFDDETAEQTEIDFRGSDEDLRNRLQLLQQTAANRVDFQETDLAPKGPGRPKLGVVAREVTLLPRHWEWLNQQPGGASVELRRLVENARKLQAPAERLRISRERTYKFMSCMAGNLENFEEASRALFANDSHSFRIQIENWPKDIRDYIERLVIL